MAGAAEAVPGEFRPTEAYRKLLDVADNARSLLVRSGAAGKGKHGSSLGKVLDEVPQVVVVGAQSSGKSSVLSRLSGVTFPTHAERCTLIGTVLKLRRAEKATAEEVRLTGRNKDGDVVDKVFSKDSHTTEEAISAAQELAVELAGTNDGFVETLEIHIEVYRPDTFDLTLIDLPGLLASKLDSSGPATVQRIVERYANMKGSLLLFIVPVSQDYDTVLGQDIVEPLKEKTTVVLTKLDKLDKDDAESRIGKIVRETLEPRVVVQANVPVGTEPSFLGRYIEMLAPFEKDLRRGGCSELGKIVEAQMRAHLTSQMPALKQELVFQRNAKSARVDELKPREAFQTMIAGQSAVRKSLAIGLQARNPTLRECRDELRVGIMNAHPQRLDKKLDYVDESDTDAFFEGALFYARKKRKTGESKLSVVSMATLLKDEQASKDNVTIQFADDKSKAYVLKSELFYVHDSKIFEGVIECIEGIVENQGLRNTALADPQPVVEHFAKLWAKEYGAVLREVSAKLDVFACKTVKEAFLGNGGVPAEARDAVVALCEGLVSRLDSLRAEANKCIARLVRYSLAPLVFTTNEHYLTATYTSIVAASAGAKPTDMSSASLLYCQWLAFRKVQVKVIVEAAAKDLIGLYTIDFDEAVNSVLDAFTDTAIVQLVKSEPASRKNERKTAQGELEELDKILAMFK
jgi:GTP-binding protein EngB required for normal cell division